MGRLSVGLNAIFLCVSFMLGFVAGIVVVWAIERRRYEVLVHEVYEAVGAAVEVMDAVVKILTVLVVRNGGSKANGRLTE